MATNHLKFTQCRKIPSSETIYPFTEVCHISETMNHKLWQWPWRISHFWFCISQKISFESKITNSGNEFWVTCDPVENISQLLWNTKLITVLSTNNRVSLSTVRYILPTTSNLISVRFILILYLHLSSYLPNGLYLAGVLWGAGTVLINRCSEKGILIWTGHNSMNNSRP
jgi:hypothetical protein